MKKLIWLTLVTLMSSVAFALPPSTDALMKALISGDELSEVVSQENNIGSIEIKRLDNFRVDESIMFLCGKVTSSRSAAVLRVEVIYGRGEHGYRPAVYSSTHYFATSGDPKDLRYCTGQ